MTTARKAINTVYTLHGQILEVVTSAKYLGVDISSVLSWNSHIDRITGNANITLGYIWRNIKSKTQKVRETAYNTLVHPQLEYAAPIWDPYTKEKNSDLKKFKEGPHAGRPVITITSQVLHLCLTNSVGEPSSKDGRMPAFVSFTRWSMELWQYPSQITSSPHIECPVTVTQ